MTAQNEIWYLLKSGSGAAAFNMAMDEVLLESVSQTNGPILRFYDWSEPAASFGYFQRYAEIKRVTVLRPLVRRPTGGGVVPHGSDWTYSVVFPANHQWHGSTAKESYRSIHEWIQTAFAKLGVSTVLADCCRKDGSGQCFTGYEQHDLLWHQQKIAGAAQRRTRFGLLIQGSVQPPPVRISCDAWQQAMCEVAAQRGLEWKVLQVPCPSQERARTLAVEKYSHLAYTQKR